jgi:hypothetical protein
MVSRLFGKLEARRHLMVGAFWAIAGIATAPAARPTPAFFKKERLSMEYLLRRVKFWTAARL